MTNQDKIRYLKQYQDNEREIQRLQEEILRWESLSRKVTTSLGDISGSNGDDKLQAAVEKIVELQNSLTEKVVERVKLRDEIERVINTVDDERLQQLLRYRYIDGHTWARIAVNLHYDIEGRNVFKLHGKAISQLKMDIVLHI